MKFYPADWRSDPALRSCTIAARGLWIEMLAIMHEATPYGSLLLNGQRIEKKRLASLAGVSERECVVLLLELEGVGVFSRDDDGTIYSRRMRRDAERSEEGRRQIAKRWGGRPPNRSDDRSDDRSPANEPITQKPEARSQKLEKKEAREDALSAAFVPFWEAWPNKVGKPAALKAYTGALKRGAAPDDILNGVQAYVREKPPDRPWLNPATFLNQNRWEDQPATVGSSHGKSGEISAACDSLIDKLNAGFGGAAPQEHPSGRAHETDARLLAYRGS